MSLPHTRSTDKSTQHTHNIGYVVSRAIIDIPKSRDAQKSDQGGFRSDYKKFGFF